MQLCMLMNNLQPNFEESSNDLLVYGRIGRTARDDKIVKALLRLCDDETLLV